MENEGANIEHQRSQDEHNLGRRRRRRRSFLSKKRVQEEG